MLRGGVSVSRMADHLNRTRLAVQLKITELGINQNHALPSRVDAEIRELAKTYWKKEIARKLNLNYGSLIRYTNKHNIKCQKIPEGERKKSFRKINNKNFLNKG